MAGLTPLPPSVLHGSTRLTHAEAHAHLSAFLENAENDAAYRPDSTLTERGPQSASTGATPNLTLHHLRRILQGIEGKRIGGEDVGRFFGEGANLGAGKKRNFDGAEHGKVRHRQISDQNPEDDGIGPGVAVVGEHDGWQDKEDYELAQEDIGVDTMGNGRHPGAHLEEPANEAEADSMIGIEIAETGKRVGLREQRDGKAMTDKDARKAAKKARHKQNQRIKEDAKAAK